jgi:hypothetical protein
MGLETGLSLVQGVLLTAQMIKELKKWPRSNKWTVDPIIQFNSILYYLCAESTATRPITDTAQYNSIQFNSILYYY